MNVQSKPSGHIQRVEATRGAILDAAVGLYHEQGVAQTTSSAIIAASGVGRTTFYRHFEDQDDVLTQALERDFQSMMGEFEEQRFQHADLEAQIVEDMVWFIRQLSLQPALALLFGDQRDQFMGRIKDTLAEFQETGKTCVRPTFQRAEREGRLRDGVTLDAYCEWCTFVVTSLEILDAPFARSEFQLRDALKNFLVPSLVKDGA